MKEATLRQLLETMRQENAAMRQENAAAHEETRRVLREESTAAHEETRRVLREENAAAHAETRAELRREMAKSVDDAKRVLRRESKIEHEKTRQLVNNFVEHFEEALKSAREPLQFLAEGIRSVDQKLDREVADIRAEMRNGFAETQAMIKFSHVELDRRITALEQAASKSP